MADEGQLLQALGYVDGTVPMRPGRGLRHTDGRRRRIRVVGGFGPEVRWVDETGSLLAARRSAAAPSVAGRPALWRTSVRLGDDLLVVADDAAVVCLAPDGERWRATGGFHHAVLPARGGVSFAVERIVTVRGVEELLTTLRTADGAVMRRTSLSAAFLKAGLQPGSGTDPWHVNALQHCRDQLLIGLRNVDRLVLYDPGLEAVRDVWTGPWHLAHDPQVLADGRWSLFDNRGAPHGSRVLVFDADDGSVEVAATGFDAPWCGSASPLPDGGWLVCDSVVGRLVEVDAGGQPRWAWDSPWATPDGARVALLAEARPDPV